LRSVLSDLVASLNARLGPGVFSLDVEVVEGQLDVEGVVPSSQLATVNVDPVVLSEGGKTRGSARSKRRPG
jgi:hypothetical protein